MRRRAAIKPGAQSDATMPVDRMNANVARDDGRAEELTRLLVMVHVTAKLLHATDTRHYRRGEMTSRRWWRGPAVEHWSLADVLSLSCARLVADG